MRPALAALPGRRRFVMRLFVLTCWPQVACYPANAGPSHPPPEVYELPIDFSGRWRGEVDGTAGTVQIDRLSDGKYYGNFRGNAGKRYILSLVQERVDLEQTDLELANVCAFTWIDGRGSEGRGWLLINREDTTITGTFGRGGSTSGMGVWTFVRDGVGR